MDDYILLIEVMEKHDITVKRFAREIRQSLSQVYKYREGERKISVIVWQVLYAMTRDVRITQLITGDIDVMIVPVPSPITGGVDGLKKIADTQASTLKVVQDALTVLSDGKVDAADGRTIRQMADKLPQALGDLIQLVDGLKTEYDRATGGS